MLLTKQKNELLKIMTDRNISPLHVIKKDDQANLFEIKFIGKPFFFKIKPNESSRIGEFTVESRPGNSAFNAWDGESWNGVISDFKQWADEIAEEIQTPDLWAEAAKTAQLFAPTAEPSDDKFTRTELAEVHGQLRLLQQSFTASALPEAAKQKLIELTETAAVKAEGLTKKDWQNWIIGGFISSITALALNPTQAGEVLKLVKAAFGGLFLH